MQENKQTVSYSDMVMALAKSGADILETLNPAKVHLWHMASGVAGEGSEVLDEIKKHVAYDKPLDTAKVIEELGDVEFYLEGIRQALGITREQVLETNSIKLSLRYSKGYSDQAAIKREDQA
jgi:NTP pyrophosphatase (non-canonical NTP hydrolase)